MRGVKIKRSILSLLAGMLCITLCSVGAVCCSTESQDYSTTETVQEDYQDSIVQEDFSNLIYTIEEVKLLRNELIEQKTIDELFTTIPEGILVNVAKVCLKNHGCTTKQEIVDEYRANRSVYDALIDTPLQVTEQIDENSGAGDQRVTIEPSSVSYRLELDTTCNPAKKIIIKEERYEE